MIDTALAGGATALFAALFAAVSAITTGLFAYRLAVRHASGQISTTSADKLWAELNKLLDTLTSQVKERDALINALRSKIDGLQRGYEESIETGRLAHVECLDRVHQLALELQASSSKLVIIERDAATQAQLILNLQAELDHQSRNASAAAVALTSPHISDSPGAGV